MALVNYESSDDEFHDEDNDVNNEIKTKLNDNIGQKSTEICRMDTSNIFGRLPAPKAVSNQSTAQSSSLNDIVTNKSSSGPMKIMAPSLKAYSEEDSEDLDEERKSKRFKGSSLGTGLSSILPKPKNSFKTKSSSLIPQSLLRPKVNSSVKKSILPKNEENERKRFLQFYKKTTEEEPTQNNINYFFSEEEKESTFVPQDLPLSDVEFGPKQDLSLNTSYETSNTILSGPPVPPSLDDIAYRKLIASKFGEEAPEQINIVDIDVSKHLSESKDWLKTISEEKEEEYSGVQPSSTARRKHQITYLALQAKQREVELKNEWARSRTTKTMSRAKYGF